jgi:superfamily II DNA helicase RecQ
MGDIAKRRRFITDADGDDEYKQRETRKLNKLVAFCETSACRRKLLLQHFGESAEDCGNCDRCRKEDSNIVDVVRRITKTKAALAPVDEVLLQKLKELRLELAKARRVPAFVIFADKSLIDMAQKKPKSLDAFANIDGVGSAKLSQFGLVFTQLIKSVTKGASNTT